MMKGEDTELQSRDTVPLVMDRKPYDTGAYEMQDPTFQPFMKTMGVS